MKKGIASLVLSTFAATLVLAAPGDTRIAVVHWNDLHGHVLPFADRGVPDIAGLPAIATLVDEIRADNPYTLVLDAGDFGTGSPESDLFDAEPVVAAYNMIKVDAVAVGEHRFDYPAAVLLRQRKMAAFSFLSANLRTKDGKFFSQPYIIKTFGQVRVGVFGITPALLAEVAAPENLGSLRVEDELQSARAMVAELRDRQRCDAVVALVHLGIGPDSLSGSRCLAANVSGIDLIVDGHSHTRLEAPLFETAPDGKAVPIVQADKWGRVVGQGIITVNRDHKTVSFGEWSALAVNERQRWRTPDGGLAYEPSGPQYEPRPALKSFLLEWRERTEAAMDKPLGATVQEELSIVGGGARREETALGDLVADAFAWTLRGTKPDFALVTGNTLRAGLAAGRPTARDVQEVLPFDDTLCALTLHGSDLEGLFSHIVAVRQGSGAFAQVSAGATWTLDYGAGQARDILIGGQPVDPERDYVVVTDSWHAAGGDGYSVFGRAIRKYDSSIWMRDALAAYLKKSDLAVPRVAAGRIAVVGENPQ